MVAADDHRFAAPGGQRGQKIVQQGHGLGGGYRFIVDIARQQHRVGLLPVDRRQRLRQDKALILDQRSFVQFFPQMQIGHMQKPHAKRLLRPGTRTPIVR